MPISRSDIMRSRSFPSAETPENTATAATSGSFEISMSPLAVPAASWNSPRASTTGVGTGIGEGAAHPAIATPARTTVTIDAARRIPMLSTLSENPSRVLAGDTEARRPRGDGALSLKVGQASLICSCLGALLTLGDLELRRADLLQGWGYPEASMAE